MKRRHLAALALALFAGAASALAGDGPPPESGPWAVLLERDLAFIHDTLAANHPGPIDSLNHDFRRWLVAGLAVARERSVDVRSADDALLVLSGYLAGFADVHTQFNPYYRGRWRRWPGFLAGWRDGRAVVRLAADGWDGDLPPVGAELVSCDGVPVVDLLREQVMPYRDVRERLETSWRTAAPLLLVRGLGTLQARPERCVVRTAEGEHAYDLIWRWDDAAEFDERLAAAAEAAGGRVGRTEIAPGEHWIQLPTFQPQGEDLIAMRELIAGLAALREAKLIVFDVRGNGGGSSAWGSDLVTALYGESYLGRVVAEHDGSRGRALWRVSTDNLAAIERDRERIAARHGEDSAAARDRARLAVDMREALAEGRVWIRQRGADDLGPPAGGATADAPADNPVHARVVLVTDGYCASACLDFADGLLRLPGVLHAGRQTDADTVYMDVRDERLPSGLGSFSVAQKVYRDRARGHNEPLEPAHRYGGDLADTEAVQAWVRTLAGRR